MISLTLFAGFSSAQAQASLNAGAAVPTEALGDGDAFVENNEIWNLTVPLTNVGGGDATAITATLTSPTSGVTILSGNSAYPDLMPASSAGNTTPYTFLAGAAVSCGGSIDFTLTVSYTGGTSPQSFNFSIATGSPGTPVTFSYTGPAVPIPDGANLSGTAPGAPVVASLPVAAVAGNVYDVDVSIDGTVCSNAIGSTTVGLGHTFVNDLELTLISPAATPVLVINNTDGSGNNFCQTILDDESGGAGIQSVVTANAPFTGSFTPNAPLSGFDGEDPNGTWQLQAQDFFSNDTGNLRAYSVTITPAVCDAPALSAAVTGTKTVSGTFAAGGTITYTVTLSNDGGLTQADNPGDEFTDVLPAGLTLVSAVASSGTASSTVGTNTATWNGSLAPLASATITITATVNGSSCGAVVSNQGTISYDTDADGFNDAAGATDDPGTGTAGDPTSFNVASAAVVTATKTVSGQAIQGQSITYSVVLTNSGCGVQNDNPGDEFTDVLPASLTLVSAVATAGTAVATVATNTVTWNGSIPANGGSVTITITAAIDGGTVGQTVSNQGTCSYDSDANNTNDAGCSTDDPGTGPAEDPTSVVVGEQSVVEIPTLSEIGLTLLCMALGGAALLLLRKRQAV